MSEKMKHSNITVSSGKLQFAELIKAHFYTPFGVPCEHPLPLPLGEVAERSEDGEGKRGLSADSSWTFTVLRPDWSLNWMALSIMNLRGLLMMRNALNS